MTQSRVANVEDYLNDLPEDRWEIISTIRGKILKNLPIGYVELGYDFL